MSFTDQLPRVATESDTKAPWNGGKDGKYFRCYLCGHKFVVGDYWRWVAHRYGNILVCKEYDQDPAQKWTERHEEWDRLKEGKFWRFVMKLENNA